MKSERDTLPQRWYAYRADGNECAGDLSLTEGWWLLGYLEQPDLTEDEINWGGGVIEEPRAPQFGFKIQVSPAWIETYHPPVQRHPAVPPLEYEEKLARHMLHSIRETVMPVKLPDDVVWRTSRQD